MLIPQLTAKPGKASSSGKLPSHGLEWNPEEESYDCPCHGSRFDREGHLIDGPAQTDCKKNGDSHF